MPREGHDRAPPAHHPRVPERLRDWVRGDAHTLGMLVSGEATNETDARGRPVQGDTLLLFLNGGPEAVGLTLPEPEAPWHWVELVNTASTEPLEASGALTLPGRCLVLLHHAPGRRRHG